MDYKLLLVDAPEFCVALCLEKDKVLATTPEFEYMIGWNVTKVKNFCNKKGWKLKENIPFNKADKIDKSLEFEERYPFAEH